MEDDKFFESVYEQLFGNDAISRGYTREDVLDALGDINDALTRAEYVENAYVELLNAVQ